MDPAVVPQRDILRGPMVMTLYSTGGLIIFGTFVLLHMHAWRRRHQLELTPVEEVALQYAKRGHMLSAGLAVTSLLLVWLMPTQPAWGGIVYALMGPLHGWNGYAGGAAQARMQARQRSHAQPHQSASGKPSATRPAKPRASCESTRKMGASSAASNGCW
jgi:hypothetical protein